MGIDLKAQPEDLIPLGKLEGFMYANAADGLGLELLVSAPLHAVGASDALVKHAIAIYRSAAFALAEGESEPLSVETLGKQARLADSIARHCAALAGIRVRALFGPERDTWIEARMIVARCLRRTRQRRELEAMGEPAEFSE